MKKIALLTCSFIVIFLVGCGPSSEELAITMVAQTDVANILTRVAMPTDTPTSTLTPTDTPLPTDTPTPEFTITPEIQQYFTEEFDQGRSHWSTFVVDGSGYGGPVLSERQVSEISKFEGKPLTFTFDQKWQYVYHVYEPFNYDDVRIDARFENQGANNNNISLICRYQEKVGWYEFNIANSGIYDILFAKIQSNGAISYGLIFSGGSNEVRQGMVANEYSVICQGNTLILYINGSLAREEKATDFVLGTGKVGVSVSSFQSLPVKVNLDWVKISQP